MFALDCNEENLLYSYYFTLTEKEQNFYITFIVPLFEILHPLYFIKVISDRWVSSDNTLPLSFKNMILPSKFPAPN
jgi:pre-mRNA-splicing helicase BRR2